MPSQDSPRRKATPRVNEGPDLHITLPSFWNSRIIIRALQCFGFDYWIQLWDMESLLFSIAQSYIWCSWLEHQKILESNPKWLHFHGNYAKFKTGANFPYYINLIVGIIISLSFFQGCLQGIIKDKMMALTTPCGHLAPVFSLQKRVQLANAELFFSSGMPATHFCSVMLRSVSNN